jgi:hypothetical protein
MWLRGILISHMLLLKLFQKSISNYNFKGAFEIPNKKCAKNLIS